MRIISGKYRGRKIECPKGYRIRPTSDMVRSAVFNILNNRVDWESSNVLDLFCGTGANGLEALSRGAGHVGFADNHRESLEVTRHNLSKIHPDKNTSIYPYDATELPAADRQYHVVIMDPPYREHLVGKVLSRLHQGNWLAADAIITIEEGEREELKVPEGFEEVTKRRYGNTQLLVIQYRR